MSEDLEAQLASLVDDHARVKAELRELLELQTATSEVLRLISANPGDLPAVLRGIVKLAAALCEADSGSAQRIVGDELEFVALSNDSGQQSLGLRVPRIDWPESAEPQFVDDVHAEFDRPVKSPARSLLTVPLLSGDHPFGHLTVTRFEVRPFEPRHGTILKAFAEQASIAISNAKLFNDLDETLELQTATSGVLRLISEHPGDLNAVFSGIVEQAALLCDADAGVVHRLVGDEWEFIAVSSEAAQSLIGTRTARTSRANPAGPTFIDDLREIYGETMPARSSVTVPLFSDGVHFGQVSLSRLEVRPFDAHHGEILQRFAEQASIAISNAKLFNDLDEALARQQAMTDVLDAVSTAHTDLQPVFDKVAEYANRFCDGTGAVVMIREGGILRPVAQENFMVDPEGRLQDVVFEFDRSTPTGEAALTGEIVHITDWDALPDGSYPASAVHRMRGGAQPRRSVLVIPMKRDSVVTGVVGFLRDEVGGFSPSELSLLKTFVGQAAVAVNNARLLREIEERNAELGESLELQTATSDVLRLISSRPGDLHAVMTGLVERATRLVGADQGSAFRNEGDAVTFLVDTVYPEQVGTTYQVAPEMRVAFENSSSPMLIDDIQALVRQGLVSPEMARDLGSCLSVPLWADGQLYGSLNLNRFDVRPYTDDDARIVTAFAEQASIAISNARLFNDLDAALTRQTANAEILRVISTSPGDLGRTLPEIYRAARQLTNALDLAITYGDDDELTVWDEHQGFRTVRGDERRAISNRITDQALAEGRPLQLVGRVVDWRDDNPTVAMMAEASGIVEGVVLFVPMRGNVGKQGFIMARRDVPVPFSDEDVALLEEFTAQAVIALDNAELLTALESRNNDLAESLELQTATSEVLTLISANPGDLRVVLDGIAERAAALGGATTAQMMLVDGDVLRFEGMWSTRDDLPSIVGWEVPISLAGFNLQARDRRVPRFVDDFASWAHERDDPTARRFDEFTIGSFVSVALLRGDEWLGNINLCRFVVDPFDPKVGPMLQAFADQAVLAIQNADLFHELEQRNREVKAALEQQTAVGAVLQTISRSAFDLGTVLNELAEQAYRLVGGTQTGIVLVDRQESYVYPPEFRTEDGQADPLYNSYSSPEVIEFFVQRRGPFYETISVDDPAWDEDPIAQRYLELNGTYTHVSLPLLQDDRIVGFLIINRTGTTGFNDSEKRLSQTFADQAVIAIENARLFNELEERNREVSEALEQQTASAEVMRVIGMSPGDIAITLPAIAGAARRLCDADFAGLGFLDTGSWQMWNDATGLFSASADGDLAGSVPGAAYAQNRPVRVDGEVDVWEADYPLTARIHRSQRPHVQAASMVAVPLRGRNGAVGSMVLTRFAERPFDDRQTAILQSFADQAVIAIDNARLFKALEESNREVTAALEQQTAVASVLQTISRSAFDLDAVLNELVEQAHRLVPSLHVAIRGLTDRNYGSTYVYPIDHLDHYATPGTAVLGPFEESVLERNRLIAITVRDADRDASALAVAGLARYGPHSVACVPMRSSSGVVGLMSVIRDGEARFTDVEKQVLQTFADQAVIAIENSRLFRELEESNREVSAALEQQTAVAAVLQTISRSAFDIDTVLDELATQAHRLVGGFSTVLNVYRDGVLVPAATVGHTIQAVAEAALGLVSLVIEGRRPRYFTAQRDDPSVAAAFPAFHAEMHRLDHTAMSVAFVPLISGTDCIGAVAVTRTGDARFTDSEQQLLQTFADQAVIAVENARLFSELQTKTEELEIASRHKSEFLANMSHELRTPLNAIIGYSELIAEECEDIGAGELIPDLGKIQSAGKHLLTLISGILDLAKVEAGRMDLFVEPIDIAAMVTEVDQIVRPLVEKNRNTFVLDCPAEIGAFDADLVKVKQVLFNLLSNSAKFTDNGTITLAIARHGESVDFAITDTGIGMTDEQVGRLFEAFSQADVSTTRKYGGTGLGLALSRSFCQMMGGDISVTSQLGAGSTFTVTLPITQQG